MNQKNIHPIRDRLIAKKDKQLLMGHRGSVFWLYGLSGSGKSTLAVEIESRLHYMDRHAIVLDGDNLRSGLNNDLGFSDQDRMENIRRVSEVAKILVENGVIVLVSLITPRRQFRKLAKSIIGEDSFHEIFVKASFATCQERDVKGLYAKAEKGGVKDFTGKGSSFEEPDLECFRIESENESLEDSADRLFTYILQEISLNK